MRVRCVEKNISTVIGDLDTMSTPKVVCVLNMKGGVGKTTLAVNVAYASAYYRHKRMLLVDVDPQFNATQYLMKQKDYISYIEDELNLTVLDVYRPRTERAPSVVVSGGQKKKTPKLDLTNITVTIFQNKGRLDIIPSTLQLMELEISTRGTERRLKNFIDQVKNAYDLVLIDCPPTLSIFTLSAYLASDAVLVPIKPDWLSTIGLPLLEKVMEQYEEDHGHKITQLGIIFTMVDIRTTLMKDRMEEISKTRRTFKNYLRQSIRVAEAIGSNQPLFLYERSRTYGEEIKNITNELWNLLEAT